MMKGARGHGDLLSVLRAGGSPGTPGTGGSCTPGPSTGGSVGISGSPVAFSSAPLPFSSLPSQGPSSSSAATSSSRRAAALAIFAVEFVVDVHGDLQRLCETCMSLRVASPFYTREAGEARGRVERRDGARVPSCQALAAWRQGGGRCTRIASGASRAGELGMAGRRGMCVQFCTTAGAWD